MVIPTTTQVLSFFNLLVGLMLVVSLILFIGGFVLYLVRLGTWPTYRDEAVELMMWGVTVLFTIVLLLALQQFLLSHLALAVSIVGMIIIVLVAWLIIRDLSGGSEEKKVEERRPR
jgi:hypothetical protein